jgi:superfamily I DNA/RNA helicase
VQDTLSYIRLALNRADDAAFSRIFNTPPRRLGDAKGKFMALLQDLQVRVWVGS